MALAFSDKVKQKRAKGMVAATVPISISRSRCSVRGNKAMPQCRAKKSARTKAAPSTRKVRKSSFKRKDIE